MSVGVGGAGMDGGQGMIFREIWTDEWLSVEATDGIDDTTDEEVV